MERFDTRKGSDRVKESEQRRDTEMNKCIKASWKLLTNSTRKIFGKIERFAFYLAR